MLRVLLTSVAGSLVCKRRLSAFLKFAFFLGFLSNLNGCPDPVMSRRMILKVVPILLAFFGSVSEWLSDSLRSVGGLQVASG